MKTILIFIGIIIVVVLFTACPTPYGILYGDQIIHWTGENESIEDWIEGDSETTDVTIVITWPWDEE